MSAQKVSSKTDEKLYAAAAAVTAAQINKHDEVPSKTDEKLYVAAAAVTAAQINKHDEVPSKTDGTPKQSRQVREIITSVIKNPIIYAIASVVEIILLILILYKWNPFNISGKMPALCSIFIMFAIFFQLMTFIFVYKEQETFQITKFLDIAIKIIVTLATICGMVMLIYSGIWMVTKFPSAAIGLIYFLNILIVVSTIAIVYAISREYFNKDTSVAKFMGKNKKVSEFITALIFYIPCALIELVEWAKTQYNITTNSVLILLSVEVFLISLRILIPKLLKIIIVSDKIQLLRAPVYLNIKTELGKYPELDKKPLDDEDENEEQQEYIYSVSAWFWINPQPPSTRKAYTKYTNIIEYGRQPAVEFNGLENTLRVICRISDTSEITIAKIHDIDLQVWNNIVINYDGSTMDVFLNGELVGSKPNIAPQEIIRQRVNVGEDKGIEGGICNVTITNKILQKNQIDTIYKTLRELDVPLV
jgi:hypothetical protein